MPSGIGEKKYKKYFTINEHYTYNNDVLFNPINPVNLDSNPLAAAHKISGND
jgi:hypothetical protein